MVNTSVHSLSLVMTKVTFWNVFVLTRMDEPAAVIGNFSASAI